MIFWSGIYFVAIDYMAVDMFSHVEKVFTSIQTPENTGNNILRDKIKKTFNQLTVSRI